MSKSGGGGNFSNGQFGGLPLGGGGGQGTVPAYPQNPGMGGGFGQQPMMGNRPAIVGPKYPLNGMPPMGGSTPQTGGLQPPQSTASPYPGPASHVGSAPPAYGPMPAGVSMGFSPPGTPGQNPAQMGLGTGRVAPMQAPGGDYGSDFLMRALRGG